MEKKKAWAKKILAIAIVLMLISMAGASVVQTGSGAVTVKDLRWETTSGVQMSGLLFVPKTVSAANKAPAIVVSHGMFNNREMQDANYVELSRRGYVVLSMDMFSHGQSENIPNIGVLTSGMYEAVKMLASINYVDTTRIGITGHSLGGMSSNAAIAADNAAPEQLIAAVLLNCADATYVDANNAFTDVYGGRDVGVIAAQYDEFFMRTTNADGTTTAPRDYLTTANAQSFLYYGTDPEGSEARASDTVYHQTVDGQDAMRVIYNPEIIHPWSHFSARSTADTIDFFNEAFGDPNPIASDNQVWQLKEFFNCLGLIGFAMFLVSFATLMLFTPFFSSLRAAELVTIKETDEKSKRWLWGMLIASAAFGALMYLPILNNLKTFTMAKDPWPQSSPYGVGSWALACGIFTIVLLVIFYCLHGKKTGFDLAERGVKLPFNKLGKTLLFAAAVVSVTYSCVFFADYFFKTDFRLWVLGVKAFNSDKIFVSLFPTMTFLLVYYIANSVAVNSFNFVKIGKREWLNTAVLAVFNVLPVVIILLLQYVKFRVTGQLLFSPGHMQVVWTFPLIVILPVTAIISRKLYKLTNNPYLAGLINGVIAALIACTNTLTWS